MSQPNDRTDNHSRILCLTEPFDEGAVYFELVELRAVSDRRESALGDLDSQDVSNGRVSLMHRFAGTACLALILLIYESV